MCVNDCFDLVGSINNILYNIQNLNLLHKNFF